MAPVFDSRDDDSRDDKEGIVTARTDERHDRRPGLDAGQLPMPRAMSQLHRAGVHASGSGARPGSETATIGSPRLRFVPAEGVTGLETGESTHRAAERAEDGAMDVADMTGKTVVITGGNSGIGLETAVALARAGAKTVITARDPDRGDAALTDIRRRSGNNEVDVVVFDLASLASIRVGATRILGRCDRIDVLVNNAGLVLSERRETEDGFEATFAVNHLGAFLLTQLLLHRIKASAPARVVNVSSTAHRSARRGLAFDDLQSRRGYRGMQVYARSKLANIYFTTELARRLTGTGVTVTCLHPGTVATGFARDGDASGLLAFGVKVIKPFILTAEQGARTSVYLASCPEVAEVTGQYFMRRKARRPSRSARDAAAAHRLWEVSEALVAEAGAGTAF